MRLRALGESWLGAGYRPSRMHWYISCLRVISKGEQPVSAVYLPGGGGCQCLAKSSHRSP